MSRLSSTARAILAGRHADPFSYLGQHREKDRTVVCVFLPNAKRVAAVEENGKERELSKIDDAGLFAGAITDFQHYKLRAKFGEAALPAAPEWLRDKVKKGELGRKTGKGFYEWKDGKAVKTPSPVQPTDEMIDRLVLPMSNVCVACLREGIVDNADVVDGAMIFGTGYAPFRGGPLNYARTRGSADIVETLRALEAKFGERFKPDAGWDTFA